MAQISDELVLDISRALREVDELGRAIDRSLADVELRLDVSETQDLDRIADEIREIESATIQTREQVTLTAAEYREVAAAIEQGLSPARAIERATGRVGDEAAQTEAAIREVANALRISEAEASEMVGEFAQGQLEARQLEAATREVAAALNLSERDARELTQQLSRASQETREINSTARSASGGVGLLGGNFRSLLTTVAAYVGAREFISFARNSIQAASDLEESLSKTEVVFGDFAGQIIDFTNTAPTALGISNAAALETTATFGNLFVALGLSQQAAADLSPEIVQLGADLASFNNIEVEDALTALRSGLVGEVEPLRRLGVAINAATVEAKAMELGLVDASGEVDEAAKIQARYALIVEQTTTAQGDFARTADGVANRQRTLAANFENLQASIGAALLPAFEDLLGSAEDLVPAFEDLVPLIGAFATSLVDSVSPLAEVAGLLIGLADPVIDILNAIEGTEDAGETGAGGMERLREATLNTINPFRQLGQIIDEVELALTTGFGTDAINEALEELDDLLQAGVDPAEALEVAYFNLADQGTVTARVLQELIDTAELTDEALAGFLARQLITAEGLGTTEVEALRDALDDVIEGLDIARGGGLQFARGLRGTRGEIEATENQLRTLSDAVSELRLDAINEEISEIETAFGKLPTSLSAAKEALRTEENEIVTDIGTFADNLIAEIEARRLFRDNIATLRAFGLDDLADLFQEVGLEAAGALADAVVDPTEAARAEAALEAEARSLAAAFRAEIIREIQASAIDLTIPANIVAAIQSITVPPGAGATATEIIGAAGAGPNVGGGVTIDTINITSTGDTDTDLARLQQSIGNLLR